MAVVANFVGPYIVYKNCLSYRVTELMSAAAISFKHIDLVGQVEGNLTYPLNGENFTGAVLTFTWAPLIYEVGSRFFEDEIVLPELR